MATTSTARRGRWIAIVGVSAHAGLVGGLAIGAAELIGRLEGWTVNETTLDSVITAVLVSALPMMIGVIPIAVVMAAAESLRKRGDRDSGEAQRPFRIGVRRAAALAALAASPLVLLLAGTATGPETWTGTAAADWIRQVMVAGAATVPSIGTIELWRHLPMDRVRHLLRRRDGGAAAKSDR